ncbi:hypothetical protein HH310_08750 [Actinoplanes sp. TBRC 11911]|uniref:hypothetical protein n=1 Tax=Actinoplanes sp. TBRC 11911 TaxID=2729386 RepID=UPI00145E411F|nr:hypothetical protein [Actinoplanes sp. TBRC 11911]NMO51275.1 hypothetical protein [Actinoplanes sp. TBRC 11911]
MDFVLHSFFVSLPLAVVVWLIMVVVLAGLAALLVLPSRLTSRARDRAAADGAPTAELTMSPGGTFTPRLVESAPSPAEDLQYAGEISVAARRAAATAERHRGEWIAAQEELEAAWTAFDAADRAARATLKAGAFPLMSRRRKPGENVDRERYLHHAASEACRHREISIKQLNDIFAHRGWNPRLHPVFQEGALRNAVRDHRLAGYRQALATERKAWQTAELSAQAVRSLRLEVAAAIAHSGTRQPAPGEQWWAEQWTTADLPAAA